MSTIDYTGNTYLYEKFEKHSLHHPPLPQHSGCASVLYDPSYQNYNNLINYTLASGSTVLFKDRINIVMHIGQKIGCAYNNLELVNCDLDAFLVVKPYDMSKIHGYAVSWRLYSSFTYNE